MKSHALLHTHTSPAHLPVFPLSMANEGARVRVVSFTSGDAFNRRLTEIGINIGAELIVRQCQCSGMVLMRGESRIAIGFGMAHKIKVSPVERQ